MITELIDSWTHIEDGESERERSSDMFVPLEVLDPRSVKRWMMMCTDLPRKIRDRKKNPTDRQELRR